MSLVILLTVGSTGAHELQEGGYYNTFSSVTINGKKPSPKKSNYETQTSVDGMSDWNKDNTSPTQALSTHHVSSMALELTLWSDQKEAMVPMLVELTVSGRRYTSKSTDACADFRVRKILNLKNKTKH